MVMSNYLEPRAVAINGKKQRYKAQFGETALTKS